MSLSLLLSKKSEKARVEVERRFGESSEAATIRLIDKRHSYATRFMIVADRVISNVLVLGRELDVVQQERDPPVISSTRTARASREV